MALLKRRTSLWIFLFRNEAEAPMKKKLLFLGVAILFFLIVLNFWKGIAYNGEAHSMTTTPLKKDISVSSPTRNNSWLPCASRTPRTVMSLC